MDTIKIEIVFTDQATIEKISISIITLTIVELIPIMQIPEDIQSKQEISHEQTLEITFEQEIKYKRITEIIFEQEIRHKQITEIICRQITEAMSKET
jgi:hypothetical protein